VAAIPEEGAARAGSTHLDKVNGLNLVGLDWVGSILEQQGADDACMVRLHRQDAGSGGKHGRLV
jgi:hypothetical protein